MSESMDRVTGLFYLLEGKQKRMGSINKGAVQLNDRPLPSLSLGTYPSKLTISLSALMSMLLTSNRSGFEVIKEQREGFLGPLAGIESAFVLKFRTSNGCSARLSILPSSRAI